VIGYDLEWDGEGVNEFAVNKKTGKVIIRINKEFYRPSEVNKIIGDASKIKEKLGWEPSASVEQLVEMMARADYDRVKNNQLLM
jgi:GDPmannose 4,6-dehydratase